MPDKFKPTAPDIQEDEYIARVIFNYFLNNEGRVAPNAFLYRDNPPDDYVSVYRQSLIDITYAKLIELIPSWSSKPLLGYASIQVKTCKDIKNEEKQITIQVKKKPTETSNAHAGIYYYKSKIKINRYSFIPEDFLELATELALECRYQAF